MRLRGHYKNYKRSQVEDKNVFEKSECHEKIQPNEQANKKTQPEESKVAKEAKPVKPFKMIRQLMGNPNFNMQLMVILLSLTSDNIQMDRRIDGMTTTIEKVRNITELVNNGVQSMKMVSEVPKSIRRLLE